MTNSIEVKDSKKKDHKFIFINGVSQGEWERSQIRHLIEVLDKSI